MKLHKFERGQWLPNDAQRSSIREENRFSDFFLNFLIDLTEKSDFDSKLINLSALQLTRAMLESLREQLVYTVHFPPVAICVVGKHHMDYMKHRNTKSNVFKVVSEMPLL